MLADLSKGFSFSRSGRVSSSVVQADTARALRLHVHLEAQPLGGPVQSAEAVACRTPVVVCRVARSPGTA